MIIRSVSLEHVCGVTSGLVHTRFPEVAFAGKSNVGKSSLINALVQRKSLARTSSTPGKTQTINYYNVNGELYLVDLPGYGYTSVAVSVKEKWGQMIERYLHKSKQLKAVYLLIDIRHKPSQNDIMMYNWIVENGFSPVVIATKHDKLKRSQVKSHIDDIKNTLKLPSDISVLPFSAETKLGRDDIWESIVTCTDVLTGDGHVDC